MKTRWIALVAALALSCSACNMNGNEPMRPNVKQNQGERNVKIRTAEQPRKLKNTKPTPDLAGGKEKQNRKPQPVMTLEQLRKKYPTFFLFNGPAGKRQVALTFDDAPDAKFTPQVLDMLKKYNVKATFFVVGNRAEAHPEIVKRIIREGHAIGNHSYNHANLPKLADANFRDQVLRTEKILKGITGSSAKMIRPPYGNISENQIKWLASQKFRIVNWNIDSLDWKGLNAEQVSTNILTHIKPGAIILQHSAGGHGEDLTGTVQSLPKVIQKLRSDGVRLVTIPQMFNLPVNE